MQIDTIPNWTRTTARLADRFDWHKEAEEGRFGDIRRRRHIANAFIKACRKDGNFDQAQLLLIQSRKRNTFRYWQREADAYLTEKYVLNLWP